VIDLCLIALICVGGGAAALLSRRQPKLWAQVLSNLKWELLPKALKWLVLGR
jgi:hypothetical protein